MSVAEGTGEGSIWWRNPPSDVDRGVRGAGAPRAATEAARRARSKVRRYAVRNGCDRLVTLTYSDEYLPDTWQAVWDDIERFRRRLTKALGVAPAMVATIERGELNGRLHVHIALDRFVPESVLAEAWGRGFVSVRKIKVSGRGKRERCRRAAAYISKYVTKAYENGDGDGDGEGRAFNGRRYSVTKGYAPTQRSWAVSTRFEGLEVLRALCGGEVVWSWSSASAPEWRGPPIDVVHFGDEDQ